MYTDLATTIPSYALQFCRTLSVDCNYLVQAQRGWVQGCTTAKPMVGMAKERFKKNKKEESDNRCG